MINHEEYGRALFLVAQESSSLSQIKEDADTALAVLRSHPKYIKLMDSPAIPKTQKLELIEQAFGTLSRHLVSFLKILTERRSLYLFSRTVTKFSELYDEYLGILPVEVISAVPLSEAQVRSLTAALARKTGKRIRLSMTTDPSVLGGMTVRYAGMQIDGTLSVQLDRLAETLSNLIV